MLKIRVVLLLIAAAVVPATSSADQGILLLAHGGSKEWNARVLDLAQKVDRSRPVEVAFGMATRQNIQAAVDRLSARGVTEIVAVPLFVSSWSSVVTSTEYLLGLRAEAPKDLAVFARMNHPDPAASSGMAHSGHQMEAPSSGTTPVQASPSGTTPVEAKGRIIRMTPALNAHPIVAEILETRARALSRNPAEEAVVIVAHGPVPDDDNQRWLQDMRVLAAGMARDVAFASIDCLTLRDDAPAAVRDAATAELRGLVSRRIAEGRRVLIVPLLMSFGGIEKGIAKRLEGLPYTLADQALMPDDRLATWVLEMAGGSR
jgi:sirohydrochlorin ferrochelatase